MSGGVRLEHQGLDSWPLGHTDNPGADPGAGTSLLSDFGHIFETQFLPRQNGPGFSGPLGGSDEILEGTALQKGLLWDWKAWVGQCILPFVYKRIWVKSHPVSVLLKG